VDKGTRGGAGWVRRTRVKWFENKGLGTLSTGVRIFNAALSGNSGVPTGLCVLEEETASVPSESISQEDLGREDRDLWTVILERVKLLVSPQTFTTWFEPSRLAAVREGEIEIEGPNQFFVDWLAEHHLDKLEEAAASVLGKRPRIIFSVNANGHSDARIVRTPEQTIRPAARLERPVEADGLNPRYTFGEFVVGPNSRLAHAACRAVADKPGRVYNPLFLYGGVGLGKTHLMQAIGSFVREHSTRRVYYNSSETFMNELILAIRQGKTFEFRSRYRTVDVLLIDDIQFLSGKAGTQEEFFHTFNHLYAAGKQIVVASDRPPKEIDSLEERLLSRFESGLVTDLSPPDFETRVAILRKKMESESTEVPDDVLQHIAQGMTSNIRELEGSLIKLLAFASLTGQPVNMQTAEEALQEFLRPQRREVRVQQIQKVVANEYGVSVEALKSKSRAQRVVVPRQVAVYLARELTGLPLVEIGKRFGGRDHSTILHAYGRVVSAARQDSSLRERLERMRRSLLF
jgi:chromosomal replication initiator protein